MMEFPGLETYNDLSDIITINDKIIYRLTEEHPTINLKSIIWRMNFMSRIDKINKEVELLAETPELVKWKEVDLVKVRALNSIIKNLRGGS